MKIPLFQVDAFTDLPFKGNPAAVCLLTQAKDEYWMQAVAAEMNLSETAFLVAQADGFDLRWFTPEVEVDLCGHATLASAHVLWESGTIRPQDQARFHTKSGLLKAESKGEWIEMEFPSLVFQETTLPAEIQDALGVEPVYVATGKFDFLVEVGSEREVRALTPDFKRLRALDVRGVVVTSLSSTDEYDFVSRFFAPGVGIDEDPVTGSAHCILGPFWCERLGKTDLTAYQASARGGSLLVRVGEDRVVLGGKAVTVFTGMLHA